MENRFKFRALVEFDDGERKMVYYDIEGGELAHQNCWNGKKIARMQCTGLKDKTGTLIYERDWLKDKDGFYCYVIYDNDSLRFAVESPESYAVDYVGKEWFESSEVVGNTYENPELLQEQPTNDKGSLKAKR